MYTFSVLSSNPPSSGLDSLYCLLCYKTISNHTKYQIILKKIKFIEVVKEWMHGCVMKNVCKIKIKLENICIDLIRSIYAPYKKYSDLLGPLLLKLPPIHEVSHEIPLIDESKQLKHRLPKCPEAFCSELTQKIK